MQTTHAEIATQLRNIEELLQNTTELLKSTRRLTTTELHILQAQIARKGACSCQTPQSLDTYHHPDRPRTQQQSTQTVGPEQRHPEGTGNEDEGDTATRPTCIKIPAAPEEEETCQELEKYADILPQIPPYTLKEIWDHIGHVPLPDGPQPYHLTARPHYRN